MKIKLLLIIILIILPNLAARSQVTADTARGTAGDKLSLKIAMPPMADNGHEVFFSGCFELDNPTLFYPDRFDDRPGVFITSQSLKRLSDSTYGFSVRFVIARDSLPCLYLTGEALAGHDSLCRIDFYNITINNESIGRFSGLIINKSDFMPYDYVRFATMKSGHPVPVFSYEPVSWEYTLDKQCDLEFSVFDLRGNELFISEIKGQAPGTHVFTLGPELNLSDGLYFIRISTYSGYIQQKFCVIK